jgi:hypothetical protein
MMQVRIRYDYEAESAPLCEAPFDRLDEVIPTIKRWGLWASSGGLETYCHCLTAQFSYDEDRKEAFFEVIINTDE